MKHIKTLAIAIATLAIIVGCSNKEAKAQALLLEAVTYSTGTTDSKATSAALELANAKGFKQGTSLSQREIVMIAGRIRCKEIMENYPNTQAALKAAEVRNEINGRLDRIAQERIRALYRSE